ncbi:MAG: protein rep [Clostridia bacterium]|nr:protein rep [Clostridia bacterium]
MVDYSDYKVSVKSFEKLPGRLKYNKVISSYYDALSNELKEEDALSNKYEGCAERVKACSLIWDVMHWKEMKVKSIEGTNLCRDRFCPNCQSALALKRYRKNFPIFKQFADEGNKVYHCVFTVKNCSGLILRSVLDRMSESFTHFVKFISCRKKIGEYDFKVLGYVGAVRAVEVTYNEEDDSYHPHYHCLFIFSKDLFDDEDKVYKNSFSYSYKHNEITEFSELEVTFQKIWYLLINGIEVNYDNIENLPLGYSVMCNKAEPEDYKEVFKYAFKNDLNGDSCFDYERFKVYRENLTKIRFIQGYGALHNFEFDDETLTDEDLDLYFNELRAELFKIEEPVLLHEKSKDVLKNLERGKDVYITSGSTKTYLLNEENAEVLQKFKEKIKNGDKKL